MDFGQSPCEYLEGLWGAASQAAEKIADLTPLVLRTAVFPVEARFVRCFALRSAILAPLRRHHGLDLQRWN